RLGVAHALARFADAPRKLGGIEVAVAVEHHRGRRTVFEFQERGVVALAVGKVRIPASGDGAYTAHYPASKEAHDVGLVRTLAEHDARAFLRIHFGRHQRA